MRIARDLAASGLVVLLLVLLGRIACSESVKPSHPSPICLPQSIQELIVVGYQGSVCPSDLVAAPGVIEGDEISLLRALSIIHKNRGDYVAVLFYASWCPFSGTFRLNLSMISSLYPSIPHFAIEESVIRPSILSNYGVHGFPTLFLLNSTMRVRYRGSRSLSSLGAFYSGITGIKPASTNSMSVERTGHTLEHENGTSEVESCPFSWARSPENLLQQETYLALATVFVILRFLYLGYAYISTWDKFAWRRRTLNICLKNLWERPLAYLNRALQLFSSLPEHCKRINLRGARNAEVWASKSLASVSFGEASTSLVKPAS